MKTIFCISLAAALTLVACGPATVVPDPAAMEQRQQRNTQATLSTQTPIPTLNYSAERVNLVKRAERLNTENLNGCITLFNYGRIVGQFNVAGKVTSLNAYLTGDQRPVRFEVPGYRDANDNYVSYVTEMAESPDIDGAYGENADGVFFFDAASDAYVEWKGDFLYTDQCLTLSERPLLVRNAQ